MDKSKSERPTILVTDAGRGSAISIIRSLGRRGWRVIAADADSHSPGFCSRYVQERLRYPAPETAPDEFVTRLYQAVCEQKIDLIIPVTDEAILPLSRARAQFEKVCRLAMPERTGLAVTRDKLKTLELAERVGVPAPRTSQVHTVQEACQQGERLGWPIVLKPQVSRLYHSFDFAQVEDPRPVLSRAEGSAVEAPGSAIKDPRSEGRRSDREVRPAIETLTVCYAENLDQLARHMERFEGHCPVLLQEYYPGVGYGVELLLYQGRPLAAFQHRRLREVPINGGASAFRESVPLDPVLYDYAGRLLAPLNWTGLAMVEFKVGQDGPKLMEINGRVWGSLPLAVLSGMDFPGRLAELYLYGPPSNCTTPETNYAIGTRARNLELDIIWIASVLSRRQQYPFLTMPNWSQGVVALLELLNPAYKFDILSLQDPWPGLAELAKIGHTVASKLRSKRTWEFSLTLGLDLVLQAIARGTADSHLWDMGIQRFV